VAEYLLLNESGTVTNVIVADEDFIRQLPKLIADPKVDTGSLQTVDVYQFDDVSREQGVGIGFVLRDGEWHPPVEPEQDDATEAPLEETS
jgi:hypothetical protein